MNQNHHNKPHNHHLQLGQIKQKKLSNVYIHKLYGCYFPQTTEKKKKLEYAPPAHMFLVLCITSHPSVIKLPDKEFPEIHSGTFSWQSSSLLLLLLSSMGMAMRKESVRVMGISSLVIILKELVRKRNKLGVCE